VLGKNLRLLRTNAGYTHDKMAEKLGIKVYSYKSWERGIAEPNIAMLLKISDLFKVTVDDLIRHELEFKLVPKKPE
jgi:transcriptional regulator with XRE-family HTH domain